MPAADRELTYEVTVPAETAAGTPFTESLQFAQGELLLVEVVTPPGPSGLVGWRIACSGQQVIPHNNGAWNVGDDETFTRETYGYPNSGRYEFVGYNEDIYPHTYQVRFSIREIAQNLTEATRSEPLPLTQEGQVVESEGPAPELPAGGSQSIEGTEESSFAPEPSELEPESQAPETVQEILPEESPLEAPPEAPIYEPEPPAPEPEPEPLPAEESPSIGGGY